MYDGFFHSVSEVFAVSCLSYYQIMHNAHACAFLPGTIAQCGGICVCAGEEVSYNLFTWGIIGRNLFSLFMIGIFSFLINLLIEYRFFINGR